MVKYSDVVGYELDLSTTIIPPKDKDYKYILKYILSQFGSNDKRILKTYIKDNLLSEKHKSDSWLQKAIYRKSHYGEEGNILKFVFFTEDEIKKIALFFNIENGSIETPKEIEVQS